MNLLIGIDVGGTFTDAVAFEPEHGRLWTAKARTTPGDQSESFLAALEDVLAKAGAAPGDVTRIVHGTTVGTNAILERRGAPIGVLATEGFEDTLYLGRQKRSDMYDLQCDPETPGFLVPRRRIAGIRERMAPDGQPVTPLDEDAVLAAADRLVGQGVEALAVSYLFSYANPAHEARTYDLIRQRYPDLPVSLSHRIDPRFREYERLCVTAFDAYIRPVMERYVRRLERRLRETGVRPPLHIMHSRGGITSVDVMLERTVGTLLSGLAAGVLGGRFAAQRAGVPDGITIDVGGTSADIALFCAGKPLVTGEGRIGRYPLRQPMVDVETIGAGGGSIAYLDGAGSLRVGPRSAGADPGPACYGAGGDEPTVTDASLVLGYLDPSGLAGGRLPLDVGRAERAISGRVARPLGLTTVAAALGIHRIINAVMADALRLVSVRRGYDPRDFALVAFGGAGPVHAGRLAVDLGIPRVIVPPTPGVLSALGLLVAEIDHQEWATLRAPAASLDPATLSATLDRLAHLCADRLERDGVDPAAARVARSAELRYVGQSYELQVAIPDGPIAPATIATCVGRFHDAHQQIYGQCDPSGAVELVGVRVQYTHPLPRLELVRPAAGAGGTPRERLVAFDEGELPTPVWARSALSPGHRLTGPAIVEQPDTTTVVYPGQVAYLDAEANLILETGA